MANNVYLAWWKCAKKYSPIVIVGHFLQNMKIFCSRQLFCKLSFQSIHLNWLVFFANFAYCFSGLRSGMGLSYREIIECRYIETFSVSKSISYRASNIEYLDQGWMPRPAEKGGLPARPRAVGRGGSPPRKNNQNSGELAGQNKGPNLNFLQ